MRYPNALVAILFLATLAVSGNFFLVACSGDSAITVTGAAQKGPFMQGSKVDCQELDGSGNPTGKIYSTTTDGVGGFTLSLSAGAYMCSVSGFYYNDIRGKPSTAQISMQAFLNVAGGSTAAFINPLTNTASKLALAGYQGGKSAADAITDAETAVKTELGLPATVPAFATLNIFGGDSEGNEVMLATDCKFAQLALNKSTSESEVDNLLQTTLNTSANEMAGGSLSAAFKTDLTQAERTVDIDACMYYVGKFATENGLGSVTVPNAAKFIDTDGNGVMNADELNPGMVAVPAGDFLAGEDKHTATTDGFLIDVYEVTVIAYKKCVDAGTCVVPGGDSNCNYGVAGREFNPINCLTWDHAKAYCEWASKRLPTDLEWEKAARGTDGRIYPWGDTPAPSCENAVMSTTTQIGCGANSTMPVGSRLDGTSPYGARDMAGNVCEWTDEKNCRGGSFRSSTSNDALTTYAAKDPVTEGSVQYSGVRCAKSQ